MTIVSVCFSSCRAWRSMWSTNTSAVLMLYPAAEGKFYIFVSTLLPYCTLPSPPLPYPLLPSPLFSNLPLSPPPAVYHALPSPPNDPALPKGSGKFKCTRMYRGRNGLVPNVFWWTEMTFSLKDHITYRAETSRGRNVLGPTLTSVLQNALGRNGFRVTKRLWAEMSFYMYIHLASFKLHWNVINCYIILSMIYKENTDNLLTVTNSELCSTCKADRFKAVKQLFVRSSVYGRE